MTWRGRPLFFLLLLPILLFHTDRVSGQTQCVPVFFNDYLGTGATEPLAMKSLPDGSSIIAGRGTSAASLPYDGLVTKLSSTGTVDWSFLIGGAADDEFTGVTLLNDGGFLLYGVTSSFGYAAGKGWLVRLTSSGSLVWSMQMGSAAAGTDRVKAVQQFTDGDLVGTYNMNDSTAASDPVVFKMGLDGTLRWAHTFDDGDDDSFTSLAFTGTTIYVSGFFTAGSKRAVIVQLNSSDGTLIQSDNPYRDDNTYNEEITGLEIFNNTISYGLWEVKPLPPDNYANGIVLVQTNLAGNTTFFVYANHGIDGDILIPHRTSDSGFLLLKSMLTEAGPPQLIKINHFGQDDWGVVPGALYNVGSNAALDVTPDGGCIWAGDYSTYLYPYLLMDVQKMDAGGRTAGCTPTGNIMYMDTLGFQHSPFTWKTEAAIVPATLEMITPSLQSFVISLSNPCQRSYCTDVTPLPAGCDKTFRLEYSSYKTSHFRDVVTTPDGGRVAVGDLENDGMVVKFNTNGDVAWAHDYEEYFSNQLMMRVVVTPDNNLLVFANNYLTENHGVSGNAHLLKLDNNGNILWARDIGGTWDYMQVMDIAVTPDNGYVMLMNDAYGSGPVYNYVLRYDANGNVLWQQQLIHNAADPIYRSIFCSNDAVFIGSDSYDYSNYDKFDVDRLDLATGNQVWSNRYSAGANTVARMSRVVSINDTAYVFINETDPTGLFSSTEHIDMVKIGLTGTIIQALALQGDNVLSPQTYYYPDQSPPTVTLTPAFDFVLTNRVAMGTDTMLNIARFAKDGTPLWSRSYAAMSGYTPFNIHPQANGFIIAGASSSPQPETSAFTNCFLVKADSNGYVFPNATGDCLPVDRPYTINPTTVTVAYPAVTAITALTGLTTQAGTSYSGVAGMDATAFCLTQANCGAVDLLNRGKACSLTDTLVYYLANAANCDAAATWQFDPTFFRTGVINGDSIQLIPLRAGVSTLVASVEGNCSLTSQTLSPSVLLSAGQASLGPDTVLCDGQSIRLDAGPGYAGYQWSDNSVDSFLIVSTAGTYSVAITDNCGGYSSATVQVTAADSLFHVSGDSLKCNNDVVLLTATPGYQQYQWSPQDNVVQQANTAQVSPAITTVYLVSALRRPGCEVQRSKTVTVLTSPAINLGNDTSVCSGDSLLLNAGSGFLQYGWNTGASSPSIYVTIAGEYSVQALYSNGCYSKDSLQLISLYQNPVPALGHQSVLCTGEPRVLNAGTGYSSYLWNNGSTGSSLQVDSIGIYWVSVQDQQGCKGADTIRITSVEPPPSGFLSADTSICQYGKLTIAPLVSFATYSWSDLSTGSSITISSPGIYGLTVTDSNGCVGADSIVVTGKECMLGLYVPNAFTPNGDGHNDVFRPLLYGNIESIHFAVFSRWGAKVFETTIPMEGWDGMVGGVLQPAGTFVWYCEYQLEGQRMMMAKGTVILIR